MLLSQIACSNSFHLHKALASITMVPECKKIKLWLFDMNWLSQGSAIKAHAGFGLHVSLPMENVWLADIIMMIKSKLTVLKKSSFNSAHAFTFLQHLLAKVASIVLTWKNKVSVVLAAVTAV